MTTLAPESEGESRRPSYSNIYADTNCQLSNDPPENGGIQELALCNILEFRCTGLDDMGDAELLVSYQYELFINDNFADRELAREYLEEAMLEHLADATGTIECARRLSSAPSFSLVRGVRRDPPDAVDARFDSCLTAPIENTHCAPMVGGMTILLKSTAKSQTNSTAELFDDVIDFVRAAMEQDVYVREGSIEKVVFIENRSVNVDGSATLPGNSETPVPPNSKVPPVTRIGISIAAVLLALLLMFLFLFLARKRRQVDEGETKNASRAVNHAEEVQDEAEDDSELGNGSLAQKDSLALQPQVMPGAVSSTPSKKSAWPLLPATSSGSDANEEELDATLPHTPGSASSVEDELELANKASSSCCCFDNGTDSPTISLVASFERAAAASPANTNSVGSHGRERSSPSSIMAASQADRHGEDVLSHQLSQGSSKEDEVLEQGLEVEENSHYGDDEQTRVTYSHAELEAQEVTSAFSAGSAGLYHQSNSGDDDDYESLVSDFTPRRSLQMS